MNINLFFRFSLLISAIAAEAFSPLPKRIAHNTVETLDKFREDVSPPALDMPKLIYNFTVQQKIDTVIEEHGAPWLFQPSNNPNVIRQGWNIYYVFLEDGWTAGWHDTCKSLSNNCVADNLRFRYAQKHCYNYERCDSTPGSYDRFQTCEENALVGSSKPCSYEFNYYSMWICDGLTEIACAVFGTKGTFAPPGENNSYGCWVKMKLPSNDQPYVAKPRRYLHG